MIVGEEVSAEPGSWTGHTLVSTQIYYADDDEGMNGTPTNNSPYTIEADKVGKYLAAIDTYEDPEDVFGDWEGPIEDSVPIAPTLDGEVILGQDVFSNPGSWPGHPLEINTIWIADDDQGLNNFNSESSGFTVDFAVIGKYLAAADQYEIGDTQFGPWTGPVEDTTPVVPTLTGTLQVGQEVIGNPGSWDFHEAQYEGTFVWIADDAEGTNPLQTGGSNYTIEAAYLGKFVAAADSYVSGPVFGSWEGPIEEAPPNSSVPNVDPGISISMSM